MRHKTTNETKVISMCGPKQFFCATQEKRLLNFLRTYVQFFYRLKKKRRSLTTVTPIMKQIPCQSLECCEPKSFRNTRVIESMIVLATYQVDNFSWCNC